MTAKEKFCWPCWPVLGLMSVRVRLTTWKPFVSAATFIPVLTLTVRAPINAAGSGVIWAAALVLLITVIGPRAPSLAPLICRVRNSRVNWPA